MKKNKPTKPLGITRRDFARSLLAAGVAGSLLPNAANATSSFTEKSRQTEGVAPKKMIWGYLAHLSFNMWEDRDIPGGAWRRTRPDLRFDPRLWDELLGTMARAGLNLVVLDIGDGVRFESHPEIAVRGAWTVKQLKGELAKMRQMGLEPIPKLNFSTAHDAWLKGYSRCVSSDVYYRVCRDLIKETAELFDRPRFFHIGMDEETYQQQTYHNIAIVRQYDLWWNDLDFLANQVEKAGSRPWMWSDYVWAHPEAFYERMPRSILQSNWYYETEFSEQHPYVKPYLDLERHGYDQIPTASNHCVPENFQLTVEYCRKHISPERLLGFCQTPWRPTIPEFRDRLLQAAEQVGRAKAGFSAV